MPREIKFRAWHRERKHMLHDGDIFLEDHHPSWWLGRIVEPCIITSHGLLYWILETKLPDATDEHYDHMALYNRYMEFMQYTGLKDRNDFEIYENDVISSKTFPNRIGESYVIRDIIEFHHLMVDLAISPSDIEVIGNIHEHPHLLPKEEEQS